MKVYFIPLMPLKKITGVLKEEEKRRRTTKAPLPGCTD